MRLTTVAAVSALALTTAACGPHINYAARTRLDCPDHQGRLTRVSVSPDGKSCGYQAEGVDITLQLTPVTGDATTTLNAIEASLVGPGGKVEAASAPSQPAVANASPTASKDASQAAQEAAADAGGRSSGGSADWNADEKAGVSVGKDRHGVHVDSDSDNDRAHVSLPGLHIDADDNGAKVDVAGIHIDANDTNATVRMMHDVRLRGQAFSRERNGIRATFIAHRDDLPGGWQVVGYEASGPKTGPLAVAIMRSHDDIHDDGRLYGDIQRLVRRNGGA